MGFFSLTQDIAIDLGTANTIITMGGKIVVDEPSVVAMDRSSKKMMARNGSMLTAMETVDLMVSGGKDKSSIWAVNTEEEYHETKQS